jgi:hypothetical protein
LPRDPFAGIALAGVGRLGRPRVLVTARSFHDAHSFGRSACSIQPAFGDIAAHKYTLSSESRVAAIGGGLAKLEARGERASAVVMNPTDYWEMAIETLGSSGSGGWAFDAATGPTSAPVITVWGIPVYRDVNLPSGTALAGAWSDCDIYIGSEFRIDVSSEAGSRFDQNITGFRAEEEFGFNAEPYVRTGKFVKILGL